MNMAKKTALFTVFALALVWMITPAAMADPVKKPTTPPAEIETDKGEVDLPEV